MKGIDYALIRYDYITELNVRGMIKTDDDALISIEITGYQIRIEILDAMVKYVTGNSDYKWLNDKIVVGKGKILKDNKIMVKYYYLP